MSPNIESDPTQQVSHKLKPNDDESEDSTDSTNRPQWVPGTLKPHSANDCRNASTISPFPPRFYLNRLPPEVLHMICEELCEEEIPALRLQCKYLCEVATPHFLRSVQVRFKKTSIESLLELSKHPVLSHNVETILYEPNMVEKKSRLAWEESTRHFFRFTDRISGVPPPPKQSASERAWRLFHRTLRKVMKNEEKPMTQDELDLAWPIYQKYLQEQDIMINQDYATGDLRQAFQGFPNLTTVYINYAWGLWTGYDAPNPYEDGLCKAVGRASDDDDTVRGLKVLMPLLRMLTRADLGLLSLRVGSLNWRFFEQLGDDGDRAIFFQELKQLVKSLKDFRLVITTWTDIKADDASDFEDEEIQECREYLANGVLGRLLAAAPDLRKLGVYFDAYEIRCPIDFKYLVLDTHWPRLHTINLDSVDAHEDDCRFFLEFLSLESTSNFTRRLGKRREDFKQRVAASYNFSLRILLTPTPT